MGKKPKIMHLKAPSFKIKLNSVMAINLSLIRDWRQHLIMGQRIRTAPPIQITTTLLFRKATSGETSCQLQSPRESESTTY